MTLQQLLPDLLCATILLLFLVVGAIRGMFRTLSGLLTWLLSLWGAKLIADRCAPLLVDWLTPKLLPTVSEKLAQAMSDGAASDSLSGLLGVIPGVQSLLSQAGDSLAAALAPAVARQVALAVGWPVRHMAECVHRAHHEKKQKKAQARRTKQLQKNAKVLYNSK